MKKTAHAVRDGRFIKMSDEQEGILARRCRDLVRRINQGTISFDTAIAGIQRISEGVSFEVHHWPHWLGIATCQYPSYDSWVSELESVWPIFEPIGRVNDIIDRERLFNPCGRLDVDLVAVTPEDLGLKGMTTVKLVLDKALASGLRLCPKEAGATLCFFRDELEERERYLVMSEAIYDEENSAVRLVLDCTNSKKLELYAWDSYPATEMDPDTKLVFAKSIMPHDGTLEETLKTFLTDHRK